jgi:hypothetical protein
MKAPRRDVKVARDDGDVPLVCLARFATIDASARCAVAYLLFAGVRSLSAATNASTASGVSTCRSRFIGVRLLVVIDASDAKPLRWSAHAPERLNVKPKPPQGANDEGAVGKLMLQGRVIFRAGLQPDHDPVTLDLRTALLGTVERDAGLRQHDKTAAVNDVILGHDRAP